MWLKDITQAHPSMGGRLQCWGWEHTAQLAGSSAGHERVLSRLKLSQEPGLLPVLSAADLSFWQLNSPLLRGLVCLISFRDSQTLSCLPSCSRCFPQDGMFYSWRTLLHNTCPSSCSHVLSAPSSSMTRLALEGVTRDVHLWLRNRPPCHSDSYLF